MVTQGRQDGPQWVESYIIETSLDGIHWYKYVDQNVGKQYTTFAANFDQNTPVRAMFDREIDARFVRLIPKTWHGLIALRFEVLSCYGQQPTARPDSYTTATPTAKPPIGNDGSPTKAPGKLTLKIKAHKIMFKPAEFKYTLARLSCFFS